ncbi:MAG: DNA polymerase IV [Flavobacteriales bacterium]|nr:DNA polymerase IV [Flavobacteriales bacterium]
MPEQLKDIRKIIHIDMDAFYASVEQMDFPELKGKPLAVGGSRERGVVAAASYEARAFGVHSALASSIAARRCPDLIFVRPRFDRYKEVSSQIMEIFHEFTDLVEPLSLDEAFLDVTYNKKDLKSAIKIAMLIRKEIKERVGLTASAGISFNKFLAKTASDLDKPDGLSVILPDKAIAFMEKLPIEQFHGVGKVTAKKMKNQGVFFGSDLMKMQCSELVRRYGKAGKHYYNIVTANDTREVKADRMRKSIGAENTFSENIIEEAQVLSQLERIHETLMKRVLKTESKGRTVTLKIKYHDFTVKTRSKTYESFTDDSEMIWKTVVELLHHPTYLEKEVRLLGISISQLDNLKNVKGLGAYQLTLDF